jgi:Spo0E like sporulation regulatory protein.
MESELTALRDKLYKLIEQKEINSPEVLELSREIDIYILRFYELDIAI